MSLLNIIVVCNVLCNAFADLPSNSVITAIGLNRQPSIYLSNCVGVFTRPAGRCFLTIKYGPPSFTLLSVSVQN